MPDSTPTPPANAPDAGTRRRGRRTLLLIAAVSIAPIVASYAAYYLFPHDAELNHGTLLQVAPAPAIEGRLPDGAAFRLADLRGRWVLVQTSDGDCAAACERLLYATRQARTMQGREQDRVVRVLLLANDAAANAALPEAHPGILIARMLPGSSAGLPGMAPAVFLIDPLGNLVLRYGAEPDIKGIARDLTRLLKASRIG